MYNYPLISLSWCCSICSFLFAIALSIQRCAVSDFLFGASSNLSKTEIKETLYKLSIKRPYKTNTAILSNQFIFQ